MKDTNSTSAVILGMTANGLSVARSLGREGIPVIGIDYQKRQPGMFSRYCKHIVSPNVIENEKEFLDFLIDLGEKLPNKRGILFITADEYIMSVSRNRERISSYFNFPLPEKWIVESFLDKRKSYQLAGKYGIPYPETYFVNNLDDLNNLVDNLQYPCVLKPVYSHLWRIKYGSKKVAVVNSPKDIINTYKEIREKNIMIMVQEIIQGKDSQIFCFITYFNEQHQPLAIFTKKKERQYPVHFGVSSLSKSERNNEIINTGLGFLRSINYTGFAGMEFKRDSRDGKMKFTELNLRTLMTGDLSIVCGVDFPYICYQDLTGQEIPKVDNFREGVKLVNLTLDIVSFWHYRKLKEMSFLEWLKSLRGELHHTYFAWDDIIPFFIVYIKFFKKLCNTLIKKIFKVPAMKRLKKESEVFVLHLISSSGFFGAEKTMIELTKQLKLSNYKPYVGIIGNNQNSHIEVTRESESHGLETIVFTCKGKFDIKTIQAIRQYIKNKKINIIHSHGYKANIYSILSTINMDIKKVSTCHNWPGQSLKMKFYKNLDKIFLNKFDKVIAVSNMLRDEILSSKISSKKLTVINNGLNVEGLKLQIPNHNPQNLKEELGIKKNEKIIGTIGRLTEEKGHIYFLKAIYTVLSQYPDVKILIIGDGPLKNKLQSAIHRLQLEDKVIFTGIRDDISDLLSIMDIFVLPSLKEGTPMALLEAMAAKKPVIASKVGGIPDVVRDNEAGILVKPKDENEISEAIINLLKDTRKKEYLAINAYKTIVDRFSAQKMAQKYIELYNNL